MEDQEIQGVKFRSFVSLCFKEASRGSVERTDWLVLVGGGVLGLLAFLIPAWERTVTKALLLLPLSAFASVGVFRLLLSPYLVYRTRDLQVRIQNKELTGQITERNREIASLTHKEERTPAEQYNYETAKKCLARFGGKAAIALRHLKTCGSITVTGPGMGNSTMSTFLPPNITLAELNWALGACAGEGVVVYREPLGGTQRIYEIAKNAVLKQQCYLNMTVLHDFPAWNCAPQAGHSISSEFTRLISAGWILYLHFGQGVYVDARIWSGWIILRLGTCRFSHEPGPSVVPDTSCTST